MNQWTRNFLIAACLAMGAAHATAERAESARERASLSLSASGSQVSAMLREERGDASWDRILGTYRGPWTYRSPRVPGGQVNFQAELTFSRAPGRAGVINRTMILRSPGMTVQTEADLHHRRDGRFTAFRDGARIAQGRCRFDRWQVVCQDAYRKQRNSQGIVSWGGQAIIFTGDEYDMAGQGKEESCDAQGACAVNDYFYRASLKRS